MKDILKGVVTKILSIIVIIGLIVCGGYVAYKQVVMLK